MPLIITNMVLAVCSFTALWLFRNKIISKWEEVARDNIKIVEYYCDALFWHIGRKASWFISQANMIISIFLVAIISNLIIQFMPSPLRWAIALAIGYIFALKWSKWLPGGLLAIANKIRIAKFDRLLVDLLTLLANSLKSGLSLMQSFQLLADQMPNPVSQEFSLVLSQQHVGVTVEKSIENLGKRIPTDDVKMMVNSISCLRQTGGNVAEVLMTLANTIRERKKVEEKVKALTAQGKLQGIILLIFPFALLLGLNWIDPEYLNPLLGTPIGIVVIILFIMLEAIGAVWIWKTVSIKV